MADPVTNNTSTPAAGATDTSTSTTNNGDTATGSQTSSTTATTGTTGATGTTATSPATDPLADIVTSSSTSSTPAASNTSGTTTTTGQTDTTKAPTSEQDTWLATMVDAAKAGDPEAMAELKNFVNFPIQHADEMIKQRGDGDDRFVRDREGRDAAKQDFKNQATDMHDLLSGRVDMYKRYLKQLPPQSPLAKMLKQGMVASQKQADHLSHKLNVQQAQKDGEVMKDVSKRYQKLIAKKNDGTLTAGEEKDLGKFEKEFGSFKAGSKGMTSFGKAASAKAAHGEAAHGEAASPKKSEIPSPEGGAPKSADAKKTKGEKVPPGESPVIVADMVAEATPEEVKTAGQLVGAKLGSEQVKKNEDKARHRNGLLGLAKMVREEVSSGEPTSKATLYRGVYQLAFGDLHSKGQASGQLAGIKFFGKEAEDAEGSQASSDIKTVKIGEAHADEIYDAKPGDEDFEKAQAKHRALFQIPTKFSGDYDNHQTGKHGLMFYFGGLLAREIGKQRGSGALRF